MMRQSKKIISVLSLIFVSFSLFAQINTDSTFIIVESEMPHNLNPHETAYASDAQVLDGLYEGLFSYNPVTLDPQYAIATEYKLSRDKKRWTFKLRQNAKFSNGEPITAESVRFSWIELLKNPAAPYSSLLDIVRGAADFRNGAGSEEDVGIYVVDDYTLSVYLNSPANYLPKVLCHDTFAVIHRNPTVYSGAYVLENQEDGYLELKKNQYYWDYENTKMEKILFVQASDADEISYLYNMGGIDWISASFAPEKIINQNAIQYSAQFGTAYFFFKLSNKKKGIDNGFYAWDYPEFRNAVLEAWPWEDLQTSLIPATTFVYPLSGYSGVEGFSYSDSIEAKSIMKNARQKYGLADDQIIDLNFEISEFSLMKGADEIIKKALEPLGINVNFIVLKSYEYLNNVPQSNSDLFIYTWIGDFADPLAFLELFHGSSTLNDSGWKSEEYDLLLEQAELASGEERYKLLSRAENLLLDSGMVIPYYHPVSTNVVNLQTVGGWSTNAFDIHPLKYLYKKEEKSKIPNVVLNK